MKRWTFLVLMVVMAGCAKNRVAVKAFASVKHSGMTDAQREDLAKLLKGAVLTFDFDEAMLTPFSRGRLEMVADALRVRPWAVVQVAGHCDERGTEEYNLALGQRRAEAARHYLIALGVDPQMVQTVSYGSEMPVVDEHDEDAWAQNRRDELKPMPAPGMEFLSSASP